MFSLAQNASITFILLQEKGNQESVVSATGISEEFNTCAVMLKKALLACISSPLVQWNSNWTNNMHFIAVKVY